MSNNAIEECQQLVNSSIPNEFREADSTAIGENPERLVEYGNVSLWGQHLGDGSIQVNLRRPTLLAFLRRLAASGVGHAEEHDNVRYKFINSK
jgi:hypothetical protein